jgi:3-hydroxyisobutyrate dehydrogenase-like beta-hydroxyacid dehydrogenase
MIGHVMDQGVGILHPGSMGAEVGRQIVATGTPVRWLPQGRGEATRRRAESAGLRAAGDLGELAATCWLIISVCPPAAALDVAEQVAESGFTGVYAEANAISPQHARQIADLVGAAGGTVVDGGIVGPPPRSSGASRLYLSGPDPAVERVRALFDGTFLEPVVMSGGVGRASALKLAFASYNKLTYALAAQACALADGHGVLEELLALAHDKLPHTPLGQAEQLLSAGPRAWRWVPEMGEIAEACAAAGLPDELVTAASALFERWESYKDTEDLTLDQLIAALGHA